VSYALEWSAGPALLGAVLLLLVPSFALIGLVVVAIAAVAALVALAGAMLAMPYLLVRSLRRRLAKRRESTEASIPIAIAETGRATRRSGVAAFAEPGTARSSGGE
jgi:positive regulator of sigma E activity